METSNRTSLRTTLPPDFKIIDGHIDKVNLPYSEALFQAMPLAFRQN